MKDSTTDNKPFKIDLTDLPLLLAWCIIFFITRLFMHGADHFLALTPTALGKYFSLRWVLIAHITAGGGSLLLGLIQFWPRLRNYSWKLHRVIGLLYLLAVALSSACAAILAFTTAKTINWAYAFSLQVWVSVWISATGIAYYAIIKGRVTQHKEWMTRSYLVTLAFIVSGLALKTSMIQRLGSFADISPSLFWMGWSVPLYIYEMILSNRKR